ncbi:UNVERIFIED_CONTAM: hypothetical protein FKN15_015929 [Acipenser sinensis]
MRSSCGRLLSCCLPQNATLVSGWDGTKALGTNRGSQGETYQSRHATRESSGLRRALKRNRASPESGSAIGSAHWMENRRAEPEGARHPRQNDRARAGRVAEPEGARHAVAEWQDSSEQDRGAGGSAAPEAEWWNSVRQGSRVGGRAERQGSSSQQENDRARPASRR